MFENIVNINPHTLYKKTYFFGFAGSVRTPLVFFKEIVILNYSKVLFWL